MWIFHINCAGRKCECELQLGSLSLAQRWNDSGGNLRLWSAHFGLSTWTFWVCNSFQGSHTVCRWLGEQGRQSIGKSEGLLGSNGSRHRVRQPAISSKILFHCSHHSVKKLDVMLLVLIYSSVNVRKMTKKIWKWEVHSLTFLHFIYCIFYVYVFVFAIFSMGSNIDQSKSGTQQWASQVCESLSLACVSAAQTWVQSARVFQLTVVWTNGDQG